MQPYHTAPPDRRVLALQDTVPASLQRYFWQGKLDMVYILQNFTDSLQMLYSLDQETFTESELSLYFRFHMASILEGRGNCREQGNSPGDLQIVCMGCKSLIRLRVWGSEDSRRGWIRQLEQDMEQNWVEEGYLVHFHCGPAGPLPQGWLPKSETSQRIYEVGIAYGEGL